MKTKLRFLGLLAVIALIVAACGGDTTPDTTEGAGETPDTTAAEEMDVIEIDFWVGFTDERRLGYAEDRAAEFNALHPDYNVKVTGFASYNELFDSAVLSVDSGEPAEIIHFFEAATRTAIDAVDAGGNPIFKSITEAIGGRTEILGEPVVTDSVVAAAKNYYTVDGSFYSMPWNTSSTVLLSNMDILAQAGITEPPATWGEVTAACEKIMAATDLTGCISWPNHGWHVEQSLAQQGELFANNDNGRSGRATEVFLDSQGMIDYVSWWKDLADKDYYFYTGIVRDWDGVDAAFIGQELAFEIDSSSDMNLHQADADAAGFELRGSPMPFNENVDYVGNIIGGATLWMINGLDTETEDGVLAFMNFFSNPENAAAWHKLTGYIPITEESLDLLNAEGYYEENPNAKVASDQLAASADVPATAGALVGNLVAIRDVVTAAIEDILVNDLDVATRMATANEEANKILTEYEALFGG